MRRTAILLAGIALLNGCSEKPVVTEASTRLQASTASATRGEDAAVNQDLATLRQATASFHDFETAKAAGWSTKITDCMATDIGGMGFHYGNVGLIDATAEVDKPELLLYEPEANGRLRLVGVEYIVPYTFVSRSSPAPELFGRKFSQVDAFQLWGLHAWVWKENPSGIFTSWNPTVGCENAPAMSAMAH
jgi:hypothetical protein